METVLCIARFTKQHSSPYNCACGRVPGCSYKQQLLEILANVIRLVFWFTTSVLRYAPEGSEFALELIWADVPAPALVALPPAKPSSMRPKRPHHRSLFSTTATIRSTCLYITAAACMTMLWAREGGHAQPVTRLPWIPTALAAA